MSKHTLSTFYCERLAEFEIFQLSSALVCVILKQELDREKHFCEIGADNVDVNQLLKVSLLCFVWELGGVEMKIDPRHMDWLS